MSDFEDEQELRLEFKGESIRSVIDGETELYFPPEEKFKLTVVSTFIIGPAILLVIGIVSIIFYTQVVIHNDVKNPNDASSYSTVTSIANAVQIQVLNYLYGTLAIWLTTRENHRSVRTVLLLGTIVWYYCLVLLLGVQWIFIVVELNCIIYVVCRTLCVVCCNS